MSIATEIERLQNAKQAIKTSINNKGGTLTEEAKLDTFATAIDNLPSGGEGFDYETATDYIEDFNRYFTFIIHTASNLWEIKCRNADYSTAPYGTICTALFIIKINLTNPSGLTQPIYAPLYWQSTRYYYQNGSSAENRTWGTALYCKVAPTRTETANNVSKPCVLANDVIGGIYTGTGAYATLVDNSYMNGWSFTYESHKCVLYQEFKIVDPS